MRYTEEQEASFEAVFDGLSFKQIARAGCGKTFFCREAGKMLKYTTEPQALYVAFNNSVAEEARKSFTDNVYATTFNALALLSVDEKFAEKLQFVKEPPSYLANRYNLKASSFVNQSGRLTTMSKTYMGRLVQQSVEKFCRSADETIGKKHIEVPYGCDKERAEYIRENLIGHVQKYWEEQSNPNGTRGIIHGVYTKIWQLSKPVIDCTLIVDEGQDLDEVMIDVFSRATGQQIWTGDNFQSIYGWRGAVNALEDLDLPQFSLSQSFRFGQNVGDLASSVLDLLDNKIPVKGLRGKETVVDYDGDGAPPDVYLCRTNAGAMQVLVEAIERGERTAIDAKSMGEFKSWADAASVLLEKKGRPSHPILGTFNTWGEFVDFTESPYGGEFRTFANLVNEYGVDYIKKLSTLTTNMDSCQNFVTTIHKFKGLEAKRVQICEFINHRKDQQDKHYFANSKDELMLLYVALTRATDYLDVSPIREELAKTLRTVRPCIIEEFMQGSGIVYKPEQQTVVQPPHKIADRSVLRMHMKKANEQEKINKQKSESLQM